MSQELLINNFYANPNVVIAFRLPTIFPDNPLTPISISKYECSEAKTHDSKTYDSKYFSTPSSAQAKFQIDRIDYTFPVSAVGPVTRLPSRCKLI